MIWDIYEKHTTDSITVVKVWKLALQDEEVVKYFSPVILSIQYCSKGSSHKTKQEKKFKGIQIVKIKVQLSQMTWSYTLKTIHIHTNCWS